MVALPGGGGKKTNSGDAIFGDHFLEAIVLKTIGIGRKSIKVQHDWGLGHSLGLADIEVDGIAIAPLQPYHLQRIRTVIADVGGNRYQRSHGAAGQRRGSPIFFRPLETSVPRVSNRWRCRLKLLSKADGSQPNNGCCHETFSY